MMAFKKYKFLLTISFFYTFIYSADTIAACDMNSAIMDESIKISQWISDLAAQEQPLINQQKIIIDKAKLPDKPLKDQLPQADLDNFDKVNVQLKYLKSKEIIGELEYIQLQKISNIYNNAQLLFKLENEYLSQYGTLIGLEEYLAKSNLDTNKKLELINLLEDTAKSLNDKTVNPYAFLNNIK